MENEREPRMKQLGLGGGVVAPDASAGPDPLRRTQIAAGSRFRQVPGLDELGSGRQHPSCRAGSGLAGDLDSGRHLHQHGGENHGDRGNRSRSSNQLHVLAEAGMS